MDESTKGTISTITAFFLWGAFPIYWKALQHISSTQILAHRVVWSLVFVLVLLSIQRRWNEVKNVTSFYPNVSIFLVTSFLLGGNWLIYIWAVNSNQIVEASLGYFINPLVNVCLGMVFLRERLYRSQFISVVLAFVGVLFLTLEYGRLPWIALTLALTFGTYGLLRKTAKAGSMVGLLFDTGFLAPIFLLYILFLAAHGSGAFTSINLKTDVLLIGAGVVTAVPLLLFAYGARRIQYSTVGFLQYIAPTGQLLVGVLLYREQFTRAHAIAFGLVWVALFLYSTSTFVAYKRRIPS
ncbi:MAG: EamA family transporter RarD [Deltaproteobacteria bacterium]|nr:MAG: EamA family transporter RarD [Deltaproteobacteria bacterium]